MFAVYIDQQTKERNIELLISSYGSQLRLLSPISATENSSIAEQLANVMFHEVAAAVLVRVCRSASCTIHCWQDADIASLL